MLAIIREARKNKHNCMFQSGMFSDSYTYILRYCNRRIRVEHIRKEINKVIRRFIKIQAFACMAMSGNDRHRSMPSPYVVKFLSGFPILLLLLLVLIFCENQSFPWVFLCVCIVIEYSCLGDRFYKYCASFQYLPEGTRLRWKIGTWLTSVSMCILFFVLLYISTK